MLALDQNQFADHEVLARHRNTLQPLWHTLSDQGEPASEKSGAIDRGRAQGNGHPGTGSQATFFFSNRVDCTVNWPYRHYSVQAFKICPICFEQSFLRPHPHAAETETTTYFLDPRQSDMMRFSGSCSPAGRIRGGRTSSSTFKKTNFAWLERCVVDWLGFLGVSRTHRQGLS